MQDKSYATFGLTRSLRQVKHAIADRSQADQHMNGLVDWVKLDESRIEHLLGEPVRNKNILEIGPGQGMERAQYFGVHNKVDGLDYDVIPRGFQPDQYVKMVKANGLGRLAKTVGRKIIVGGANRTAWAKQLGVDKLNDPTFFHGDICTMVPKSNHYDVVTSWSVFEHVADPHQAVANVIDALKPGGVFYISLHLYTCNNGHHDMRSFTGDGNALPLFAHLRPSQQHHVTESCYLNRWRLNQYREVLNELAPGHTEWLEKYEHEDVFKPQLTPDMWEELSDYTNDELFTCNLVYAWKKPPAA